MYQYQTVVKKRRMVNDHNGNMIKEMLSTNDEKLKPQLISKNGNILVIQKESKYRETWR
jgi:hypothetical protein